MGLRQHRFTGWMLEFSRITDNTLHSRYSVQPVGEVKAWRTEYLLVLWTQRLAKGILFSPRRATLRRRTASTLCSACFRRLESSESSLNI